MTVSGWAVDLGGTKTAAARIDNGAVTERRQVPTDPNAGWQAQVDAMAGLLVELGHAQGDPLGVAVAGRVDRHGNWHAVNTGTFQGITAAPLGRVLRERFGARSVALNDAAAAALAESRLGAGQGAANFAFLTVSTGVGGGIVLNGRLVDSGNGLAGHAGFVTSRLSDAQCGSGRIGTVESVASGRAIAAAAGLADGRAVFESGAHDAIIDRSAAAVAGLIADMTSLLGLDRVAVGGSIGLAPGYLPRVIAHLNDEPELFRPQVVAAQMGHDSGLIGAVIAAGG
ncbi:ROK family protein [Paracoccus sp. (in: a-proteobacteria)]|uniref:ROK family protein n=1 Tax=Paracoccus sp. TaxID=267 RepID=UPI0026E008EE|nr:ROK family protein [Paracoccus sp. (in: a-proteobacteria)]MDO5648485.1 ROK family protein [Paracoccus sp. (in: a-proteobacteria)]